MKIQLIQPPSKGYSNVRDGYFQPLGLLSIATYLKERNTDIELEILDGDILTLEEILKRIKTDSIVGISANTFASYENVLSIAEYAKSLRNNVVLGGHYATSLGARILHNRNFIDVVVLGDGEIAFSEYCFGKSLSEVNNLIYRGRKEVKTNQRQNLDLNKLPIPNRGILNLQPYFEHFKESLESRLSGCNKAVSFYTQKGCLYSTKHGRCSFCARTDLHWRAKEYSKVWQEIEYLTKEFGIDYFWEVSDSLCGDEKWLNELKESKPNYLSPKFLIFGRVNETQTKEKVKTLKEIGVYAVILGIESGVQYLLDSMNKGITLEQTHNTMQLLSDSQIYTHLSLVLGAPGETEQTLNQTYQFVESLLKYKNILAVSASPMLPLPGTKIYSTLMKENKRLRETYATTDLFDFNELQTEWFDYLGLSYEHVEKISKDIRDLSPGMQSGFARKKY